MMHQVRKFLPGRRPHVTQRRHAFFSILCNAPSPADVACQLCNLRLKYQQDAAKLNYISTWPPSSITRFGGMRKNSVAGSALRSMKANTRRRNEFICERLAATIETRPTKNEVSIMAKTRS